MHETHWHGYEPPQPDPAAELTPPAEADPAAEPRATPNEANTDTPASGPRWRLRSRRDRRIAAAAGLSLLLLSIALIPLLRPRKKAAEETVATKPAATGKAAGTKKKPTVTASKPQRPTPPPLTVAMPNPAAQPKPDPVTPPKPISDTPPAPTATASPEEIATTDPAADDSPEPLATLARNDEPTDAAMPPFPTSVDPPGPSPADSPSSTTPPPLTDSLPELDAPPPPLQEGPPTAPPEESDPAAPPAVLQDLPPTPRALGPDPSLEPPPPTTPTPETAEAPPAPVMPPAPAVSPAPAEATPSIPETPIVPEAPPAQPAPAIEPAPPPTPVPAPAPTPTSSLPEGFRPLPNAGREPLRLEQPIEPARPIITTRVPARSASAPGVVPVRRAPDRLESAPHVVQSGENFWTISRDYYGSGRYYKALWKANADRVRRPEDLHVGDTIRVPPPERLDPALVDQPATRQPGLASPPRDTDTKRVAQGNGSLLMLPVGRPSRSRDEDLIEPRRVTREHTVRPRETLRTIARDRLGDSRREDEIREMNLDQLGEDPDLRPGMRLRLPADATDRTVIR